MLARDLQDQLKINNPCSANWNQMIGNDVVRFCEHCSLSVHNVSELTPKRVQRLIARSRGRLCVRYRTLPDGTAILRSIPQRIHQLPKRVSKLAAGAFGATLTLTNVISQSVTDKLTHPRAFAFHNGIAAELVNLGATIKGTVRDPNGAVIQGAGITLGTSETPYLTGAITNAAGEYSLEGLQPGRYSITIGAPGFSNYLFNVVIAPNETQTFETTLRIAVIEEKVEVNASEINYTTVVSGGIAVQAAEPLIRAAAEDDLQALEALLTKQNINVRDKNTGRTALEHAVLNGDREMVQLLLAAGADVNTVTASKQTVLMFIVEETGADIVWDLINAGAKVNLKDEEGDTALIEAAMVKNLPALMVLLHAGAKTDAKNDHGETALMQAASYEQLANIRALIKAGADVNARNKAGKTALDYAMEEDHERAIKLLRSYGAVTGTTSQEEK